MTADTPVSDDEGADQPQAFVAPPVRRRSRVQLTAQSGRIAAIVALAILAAATIGFAYGYFHLKGQQNATKAAEQQARGYILAFTNFDPKSLDADIPKIESYTTGNFRSSTSQFFTEQVRGELLANNAASRGEIRSIYTQSFDGNQATFFAIVDVTVANNQLKAPQSDQLNMIVTMTNTSHGWRVSDAKLLQSPEFTPTQPGLPGGNTGPTTPRG